MARRGIELALISSPDNIFYLTGLDHWGYFAPHMLMLRPEGEPVLVTRQMEQVTIANQVKNARFAGHTDSETVADIVLREIEAGPPARRIGLEMWVSGLPAGLASAIQAGAADAVFTDITGLVDDLRLVKSLAEQDHLRAAAAVTDAAAGAGIEVVGVGASEAEVAAACLKVMTERGTYPGFGPFIRSTEPARRGAHQLVGQAPRLWRRGVLRALRLRRPLSRPAGPAGLCRRGPGGRP